MSLSILCLTQKALPLSRYKMFMVCSDFSLTISQVIHLLLHYIIPSIVTTLSGSLHIMPDWSDHANTIQFIIKLLLFRMHKIVSNISSIFQSVLKKNWWCF